MSDISRAFEKMMDIVQVDEEIQQIWNDIWKARFFRNVEDNKKKFAKIEELTKKRMGLKVSLRSDIYDKL